MRYDKLITVQIQDENTELWTDSWHLHAYVNKTNGGQAFNAGADQFKATLTFKVRYFSGLEALRYSPQLYRVVYRGHTFKVSDYDDFQERHNEVTLVGEAYG